MRAFVAAFFRAGEGTGAAGANRPDFPYSAGMSLSLSDLTRTTFVGGLGAAAEKHAGDEPVAISELLEARLVADMFTFAQQIHAATDTARRATDRLGGAEPGSLPDPEVSVAGLTQRIEATIEHLMAVDAAAIDAATDRAMKVDLGTGPMDFTGRSYALGFALPNFLFHVATAYDIMRHRGVRLGKVDYIVPFVGACHRG